TKANPERRHTYPTQTLRGYTFGEIVCQSKVTSIYRGSRSSDQYPVLVQVLNARNYRPRDVDRMRHQHDIAKVLDIPTVLKVLALEVTIDNTLALVTEDFPGCSL